MHDDFVRAGDNLAKARSTFSADCEPGNWAANILQSQKVDRVSSGSLAKTRKVLHELQGGMKAEKNTTTRTKTP